MGHKILPVQPVAGMTHNDAIVTLDRRRFGFSFLTNLVDDSWMFGITGAFAPIRLANGPELLAPYRHLGELIPPGQLYILDQGLLGRDPDTLAFEEARCRLIYKEVST